MDLLGQARRFLQTLGPAEPPRPQPYDVACPNGHRLQGLRTEGYQAFRCPSCGAGVFILPRSPLPDPPAPASKARRRELEEAAVEEGPIPLAEAPEGVEEAEAEVEWVEPVDGEGEGEEAGATAADVEIPYEEDLAAARARQAAPPPPARSTRSARRPEPEPVAFEEDGDLPAPSGRGRHAWRFAAIAAIALVALTAGLWQRFKQREYPRIAERGRTEGLKALDAGEFDKARDLLVRARRAVDGMGGEFRGAAEIRQGADEAELITDLVDEPLERLLDQAARVGPEEWNATFDRQHKGRAILLDVHVVGPAPGGGYELDYRVLARGPNGPRLARIDTAGLKLLELAAPKPGEGLIFGARLASFRLDGDEWRITLQPDSGVIITHPRALEALGWPSFRAPAEEKP